MRVWPLGLGLQEKGPKHLKLRRLRAGVVSVEEKACLEVCQLRIRETSASEPLMRCRKLPDDVKTGGYLYTRISSEGTCLLSGRRPA